MGRIPGVDPEQFPEFTEQQTQDVDKDGQPAEAREDLVARLRSEAEQGLHAKREITVEVEEKGSSFMQVFTPGGMEEMGIDTNALNNPFGGSKHFTRTATVEEAFQILVEAEAKQRMDENSINREALHRAEQSGIIFIDELDKVAMKSGGDGGPAVSREGVQRDLLPIIEGSTVPSKFGSIETDHILFIGAGAFHISSPDDLIPELQGRLPIQVRLDSLGEDDFTRILTEPKSSLTKQYQQLLDVEGTELEFTKEAIDEIAHAASELNEKTENIGARRLHTVLEALLEGLMFDAPEDIESKVVIDVQFVRERLKPILARSS